MSLNSYRAWSLLNLCSPSRRQIGYQRPEELVLDWDHLSSWYTGCSSSLLSSPLECWPQLQNIFKIWWAQMDGHIWKASAIWCAFLVLSKPHLSDDNTVALKCKLWVANICSALYWTSWMHNNDLSCLQRVEVDCQSTYVMIDLFLEAARLMIRLYLPSLSKHAALMQERQSEQLSLCRHDISEL